MFSTDFQFIVQLTTGIALKQEDARSNKAIEMVDVWPKLVYGACLVIALA